MLDEIKRLIPALFPYVNFVYGNDTTVIYEDRSTDLCFKINMECGVTQGEPLSGLIFNVVTSPYADAVRNRNKDVKIVAQHDDYYIIGDPTLACGALEDLTNEFKKIGLILEDKNVIYSPTELNDDVKTLAEEKNIKVMSPDEGIEISGAAIGSNDYIIQFCNRVTAEAIKALNTLRDVCEKTETWTKAQSQTAYAITRMCIPQKLTHMLRTCPPSTTLQAAKRIDEEISNFIFDLTKSKKYLSKLAEEDKKITLERLFLQIKEGGNGIISSVSTRIGAYVGSICLSKKQMAKMFEPLKNTEIREVIAELDTCLEILNDDKLQKIHGLNNEDVWNESIPKVQSKINQEIAKKVGNNLIFQLSDGMTTTGNSTSTPRIQNFNLNAVVLKFQALANKESTSSAWLSSNPAFLNNQMSDDAFNTAFHIRNLFPVMGSRKWCFCGEKMDCLGWHVHHCKDPGIKNPLRNDLHEKLKSTISNISQNYVNYIQMRCIHKPEPRLDRFFKKINLQANNVANDVHQELSQLSNDVDDDFVTSDVVQVSNYNERQKEKIRADIGIYHKTNAEETNNISKAILIDVTTCCPLSQRVFKTFKPGSPADFGANEKLVKQYEKFWNVHDTSQANLIIFAIDSTTGTIGKEGKDFLKFLSKLSDKDPSVEISRIYGRLSTAIQANRAYWISKTRMEKSLDDQPQTPVNPNRRGIYPQPLFPPTY